MSLEAIVKENICGIAIKQQNMELLAFFVITVVYIFYHHLNVCLPNSYSAFMNISWVLSFSSVMTHSISMTKKEIIPRKKQLFFKENETQRQESP